jgi:uncharacterized alpha-E superfamily protein
MPGGLGLLDMQVGCGRRHIRDMESSKDIWVVSDRSVPHDTLLNKNKNNAAFRIVDGELPSSVAESLFWLGRYAERIESSARVLLGVCLHLRSDERFEDEDSAVASLAALLKSTTEVTGTLPGFVGDGARKKIADPNKELLSLLSDGEKTGSLPNTLESLSFSAATVRDRLTSDMWRDITSLDDHHDELQALQQQLSLLESATLNSAIDKLNALLFSIAAFSGLTRENMTQGDGWRFLQIGKRIERASQTSVLLSTVFSQYRDNSYALEDLLSVLCSVMTYRSRYRTLIEPFLVLHLLVSDETNPRSLGYQLKSLEAEIQLLPGRRKPDYQEPTLRTATEGLARTRLIDPVSLLQQDSQSQQKLNIFLSSIKKVPADIANAISAQYFTHTEAPNILYSGFDMSEPPTGKDL